MLNLNVHLPRVLCQLRLGKPLLLLALVGILSLVFPIHSLAQKQDDELSTWYHWYRAVHTYIGSAGGVLCQPGAVLYFHRDGQISTDSQDKVCQVSLQGLSYPLPAHAKVTEVRLPIRKHSAWPLSASRFGHMLEAQIHHDYTTLVTHAHHALGGH